MSKGAGNCISFQYICMETFLFLITFVELVFRNKSLFLNMLFKLAWRNIWRNKRRTFITLAMIQFAVVLATFMSAFRYGVLDAQVENVVGGYQGYGAINDTAFVNEPNIESIVPFNDSIRRYLKEKAVIKAYSPRILGAGMMTCGEKFKITKITGVEPSLEDSLTHLSSFVVRGSTIC